MVDLGNVNRSKIAEYVRKWKKKLGLTEWEGRVDFVEELQEDVYAEIHVDWTYLSFTIFVSEEATIRHIEEGNQKYIKEYLVHELVHLLIDPLFILSLDMQCDLNKDEFNRVREQTVERITRLLLNK